MELDTLVGTMCSCLCCDWSWSKWQGPLKIGKSQGPGIEHPPQYIRWHCNGNRQQQTMCCVVRPQ
eukprot:5276819-Amphidinium_carterae.3